MSESRTNLTALDKELANLLRPLVDAKVELQYPFFANTFPLAFHLAHSAGQSDSEPRPRIEAIPWNKPIDEILRASTGVLLFYATEEDKDRLAQQVIPVQACDYVPGHVFVDQSPHAENLFSANGRKLSDGTQLTKLLAGRCYLDVHSDIPMQAAAILDAIGFPLQNTYGVQPDQVNVVGPPLADSIRIYVYGGPLTAYLEAQPEEFLRLAIPEEVRARCPKRFNTYICIRPVTERALEAPLAEYHRRLYEEVVADNQVGFVAVYDAYNRIARRRQDPAVFPHVGAFVECLRRHCSLDRPTATAKVARPAPSAGEGAPLAPPTDLAFMLFGCGDLALGLVLPALEYDRPVAVVQVVTDSSKFDWETVRAWSEVRMPRLPANHARFTVLQASSLSDSTVQLPRRALVLADDWSEALRLVSRAGYLGTSLRGGLADLCQAIKSHAGQLPRIPILLFENKVEDKDRNVDYRKDLSERFDTYHVLCDRICFGRSVDHDNEGISLVREEYGEIVVGHGVAGVFSSDWSRKRFDGRPEDLGPVTGWNDDVMGDRDPRGAISLCLLDNSDAAVHDLYHRRKRWLVNSTHYALAILAIEALREMGISYEPMPMSYAYEALRLSRRSDLRNTLAVLIECQIGRMLLAPGPKGQGPLVDDVLRQSCALAIYENLRLLTVAVQRRCERVTDGMRRIISPEPGEIWSELEKSTEHLEGLWFFKDAPANINRVRELGVPFRFCKEDILIAERTLNQAESHWIEFVRDRRHAMRTCPECKQPVPRRVLALRTQERKS